MLSEEDRQAVLTEHQHELFEAYFEKVNDFLLSGHNVKDSKTLEPGLLLEGISLNLS